MTQPTAHPGANVSWPPEVMNRLRRVFENHQNTKLTREQWHNHIPPDEANRPTGFHTFSSAEKIALPTNILPAELPTVALLLEGIEAVPHSRIDPPHDLRSLATWLYLGAGVTGKHHNLPSNGDTHPCEVYVAAFAVKGLSPGFYYFNPHEFALRKLRDGLDPLIALKRGRPDLQFLDKSPAAVLVSTVFARSTWLYQGRGYRTALLDAGRMTENLVQAATAVGMRTLTRLGMNDATTRELIGVPGDVPYEQAEAVQAMIVWADEQEPVQVPNTTLKPMAPIARQNPGNSVVPYDLVPLIHDDCVAPGVAIRDIRPPLTETSVVPTNVPVYSRDPIQPPQGGFGFAKLVMKRQPVTSFFRKTISRDPFVAISRLAVCGPSYYPLMPRGKYASLIRPLWLVLDVVGVDNGVWYHHPQIDRWSMCAKGFWRMETAYLSREKPIAGEASAVCFLMADMQNLMLHAGPDAYRLAHLEAGIVAHRMQLAAEAQGLSALCTPDFYDNEVREFFGLGPSGWEVLYEVMIGINLDGGEVEVPEVLEEEDVIGDGWQD